MIGKTISHYKILEKLGEGGMGVVYKAEDTKLQRTVALKFLPLDTMSGADEKKRFRREAQAAAALNHPNIAHIYEIDEVDGQLFIAMEFIAGESLREKIDVGPLKIATAIAFARQIAEGLQTAHDKGIVHRDIKSANIMVTQKEQVKIMDFGLAKLVDRSMLTKEGTTLGTVAYMSPEQAQGETVDHRTDIWSLGVVLYEMISGQLPFKGEYEQAIIYSLIKEEPEPLTALRTGVPLELDGIAAKALAKKPDLRYQNVEELPADLRTIESKISGLFRVSNASYFRSPQKTSNSWKINRLTITVAVISLLLSAILFWKVNEKETQSNLAARFTITIPPTAVQAFDIPILAFSPDGTKLVFRAGRGDRAQLYLRAIDEFEALPIPGTKNAFAPFFSPDGEWIGFLHDRSIKKVPLNGGNAIVVYKSPLSLDRRNASWGTDNNIYFVQDHNIYSVPADGGESEVVITGDSIGVPHITYLQILPGSKAILFIAWTGQTSDETHIGIVSLETKQVAFLLEGATDARYAASGHILYTKGDGTLLAVSFDLDRLEISGTPFPIGDRILLGTLDGGANFTLSTNGALAYLKNDPELKNRQLMWVDRDGYAEPIGAHRGEFRTPRISTDNKSLALTSESIDFYGVLVLDLMRDILSPFTHANYSMHPVWTPDGRHIVFNTTEVGTKGPLFWKPADGSGDSEQLYGSPFLQDSSFFWRNDPGSISRNGQFLAFTRVTFKQKFDIWILEFTKERQARPLRQTPFSEIQPAISPDAKFIAYTSDESGQNEVYVQSLTGKGAITRISTNGGAEPLWAPNGRELFYRHQDYVMSVPVSMKPEFTAQKPRVLFEGPFFTRSYQVREYDITADGLFVMVKSKLGTTPMKIHVVLNWAEELKRMVPGGKP